MVLKGINVHMEPLTKCRVVFAKSPAGPKVLSFSEGLRTFVFLSSRASAVTAQDQQSAGVRQEASPLLGAGRKASLLPFFLPDF